SSLAANVAPVAVAASLSPNHSCVIASALSSAKNALLVTLALKSSSFDTSPTSASRPNNALSTLCNANVFPDPCSPYIKRRGFSGKSIGKILNHISNSHFCSCADSTSDCSNPMQSTKYFFSAPVFTGASSVCTRLHGSHDLSSR